MTHADIQAFFPFWVRPYFYDLTYGRPTNDWLFNKFCPWFKRERWEKNRHKWGRKNDCDNSARRFVIEAQDAHVDTADENEAVAIGEFHYIASNTDLFVPGPHLIACAVTEDGLVFVDTLRCQRISLLPVEFQSCIRVSF